MDRVVFFSDAVMAIAITLLVLEIRAPELEATAPASEQLAALLGLWPKYLSYVISFWVIGQYWSAHRRIMRHVSEIDGGLNALNLLFLFGVALLPFPTAVLGSYGTGRVPVVFYALCLTVVGGATWLLRAAVLTRDPAVVAGPVAWWRTRESLNGLVVPGMFLLSAGVALVLSPDVAVYMWPLLGLTPRLLGRVPSAYGTPG